MVAAAGQPVAGAAIVVIGTEAPYVSTSDDRGQFRLLSLPPGSYRIEIQAPGYLPAAHEGVVVSVGQSTTVEAELTPATEQVQVVASAPPLLERRQVISGSTLTQAELERLPTARDVWEAARMAPGILVDRVNIAGNESTEPSAISGPGYLMTQQAWSIDGVTITDSTTPGIAASFFDFEAFEEVQVTTGGSDVGLATGGAVNLVTRRGTNQWRGSARFLAVAPDLQAGLRLDARKLGAAGPWNLATPQQSFAQGNRIDVARDVGMDVGGPLLRDRLWAWAAVSRQDIDLFTIGDFREQTTFNAVSLKVDGRSGSSGTWQTLYIWNRRTKSGRNVGPLRPPETAWDFPVTSGIVKGEGAGLIRDRYYVTAAASYVREDLAADAGGGRDVNAVMDAQGIWRGSFLYGTETRPQLAARIDGRSFFASGSVSSELRVGLDHRFAWTDSAAAWPGTGGVIGLGTTIRSIGLPLAIATVGNHNKDERTITALYLQDTITAGALTANIGVRFDWQRGANRASMLPRNELLPALLPGLVFNGLDSAFTWKTLTPKLGVTYALDALRRTLVKASYRQFPDELSLTDIQHTNPTRYQPGGLIGVAQSATFLWLDDGDLRFSPREIGPIVALSGVDPTRPHFFPNSVDPDFHSPRTHEVIAGVDRDLGRGLVAAVDVTWHRTDDPRQVERLVFDDAAGPRTGTGRVHASNDYVLATPLSGTLPDGSTYTVPVYRLRPGVTWLGGSLLTNGDRRQRYRGFTASVRKRFSNAWMFRGWATVNRWTWRVPPRSAIDATPRVTGEFDDGGVVLQDTSAFGGLKTSVFLNSQWSFNAAGLYRVAASRPWGFDVAFDLQGRQGYPIPYSRTVTAAETGDGIDRQVLVAPRAASFRNDNVVNVNARLEKVFQIGDASLSLGLDVFNLLNSSTVLQRQHEVSLPVGDHVLEVISPRVLRIGARVRVR